jgi:hypothetical protein
VSETLSEQGQSAGDFGAPAQIIYEEFAGQERRVVQPGTGSVWQVGADVGGVAYRVKLLTIRGTNRVDEIWIMTLGEGANEHETVLHLQGDAAANLVALIRNKSFDLIGSDLIRTQGPKAVPDAESLSVAYDHDAESFRALIEGDAKAVDVVAVAHRRAVVTEFRLLLDDSDHFNSVLAAQKANSTEGVWQEFFESNPWLLGLGLSTQLFTGWDAERLEQVVTGYSVTGPGKRTDALMRTSGAAQFLVFAEIKHHRTSLLGKEYRSGCFSPSDEMSGAVAQSQGTVQLAQEHMGVILRKNDQGVSLPESDVYTYRPRSFVVAGRMDELLGEAGGVHQGKLRSFELFRRNLHEPEVITFDELLARAEAIVGEFEKRSNPRGRSA